MGLVIPFTPKKRVKARSAPSRSNQRKKVLELNASPLVIDFHSRHKRIVCVVMED